MAEDEKATQDAKDQETPPPGGETEEPKPVQALSAEDVEKIVQKVVGPLQESMVKSYRSLQADFKGETSRIAKASQQQAEAMTELFVSTLGQMGVEEGDLTQLRQGFKERVASMSAQEKAQLYDQMTQGQAEKETLMRAVEQEEKNILQAVGEEMGVEIPWDHPELRKDVDPLTFQRQAIKIAKKLLTDKTGQEKSKKREDLIKSGALDQLGAGPGGGLKKNPIESTRDPSDLLDIAFRGE